MPASLRQPLMFYSFDDYRGYGIATLKSDTPLYRVSGVPIFVLYFAVDDLGDPITPCETAFWSPFLAMAMIDQYISMTENERKQWWKKQGAWPMIHQNYNAQHRLPPLLDLLRSVAAECEDPDLDLLYGDASDFGKALSETLKCQLQKIDIHDPRLNPDNLHAKSEMRDE